VTHSPCKEEDVMTTRALVRTVIGFGSGWLLVGGLGLGQASAQTATASFINAQGAKIGTAVLTDDPAGVRIALDLSKLPPGPHGFHIHAVGKCTPPEFTSAGGHFNPLHRKHGTKNPEGPHAGDLPNVVVGSDGTLKTSVLAREVSLGASTSALSLFPPSGTALVIHASPDDEKTDPAGNAGARIACGVITR
jgi:Cu-Zn family superoxide dismutase